MAVSHFTDNKFGISRFMRKNIFIRSVFLTLFKNYSQRTALFDVLTILPLLVLGAVKRKPSSLFRSWGSAPSSSNTESLITPLIHLGLSILWLAQSPFCLYWVHLRSLARSFPSFDLMEGLLSSRSVCITASDKRLSSNRQNQLLKLHLQLFPTCTASGR